jgi:hypothetical protein
MLVLLAPPDDATCMNSVLNTFFQTRVSGKEEKRRIQERISGSCFLLFASFICPIVYLSHSGTHEERKPYSGPFNSRADV